MSYLAWAIAVCATVGGGVYLVMHEHPWFALLLFLIAAAWEIRGSKGNKKEPE